MVFKKIILSSFVAFFFASTTYASSMTCTSLFSKDRKSSEAAIEWLTELGFISDGSGALARGQHRALKMQIESKVNGLKTQSTDFFSIRRARTNGLIEVFLGSEIGEMRVVSLKSDKLILESDAISQNYSAREATVTFRATIEIDRKTGVVVFRMTNRDAGISETARGNLQQLN